MEPDRYVDLTNPHGLFVRVYSASDKEEAPTGQKVIEDIRDKYSPQAVMTDSSTISIGSGGDRYSLQLIEEPDCRIFVLVSNLPHGDSATKDWLHHAPDYLRQGQAILQLLPERPISQFTVLVGFADSEETAISLSERCSRCLEREEKARGITRGCLVTAFDTVASQDSDYLSQNFLVASFRKAPSDSKPAISRFHLEFIRLADLTGKLDRLCRSNEPFFRSLGAAEQEAQEAIERETIENTFLNFGNLGQTQINRLQTWLGELVTKFSGLSVLASAIRRDYAAAKMYMMQTSNMLGQWNEKALEGYPTNASTEMSQCEAKIRRFRNFLERADALRTQLETVLGSIQTYLGFAQQKTEERQGNILKRLTWVMAIFTIILVLIEVLAALRILH
jgi:hypothetical protein